MCKHKNSFNPSQCIVPPYISEKLISCTKKKIVARAVKNLVESSKIRTQREVISNLKQEQLALVIDTKPTKKATINMEVYDMKNGTDTMAAKLIWKNGKAFEKLDVDAANVVDAGKATWDLYYTIFGRNSIDNLGYTLRHYIHFYQDYSNAMWNGTEMLYGDGDGTIFGNFTIDPDIIGHELTHGVTQFESKLTYHNQSGALNESLSDVFGIMVKQRLLNEDVKTSNWLIGENVLLGKEYALRSLKAPGTAFVNHPELGTDPQPATMDKFVLLPDTQRGDWGGVHINSGIPNFAFYVAAYNMGGFSWEKAGRIWYKAITANNLQSTADFVNLKVLTVQSAEQLYGINSKEVKAVKQGWQEAKV